MVLCLKRAFVCHLVAVIVLTMAEAAAAQGSLAKARDLYTAEAYDEALALLNGLQASNPRPEDRRAIDQYRVSCLLALGRTDDATRAIQAVVAAVPSYHPSETEVSPRVRAAFRDVRQQMLPAIIQQKYAEAQVAFDRKNAISEEARTFYVALGFDPCPREPMTRVATLADIRVALQE